MCLTSILNRRLFPSLSIRNRGLCSEAVPLLERCISELESSENGGINDSGLGDEDEDEAAEAAYVLLAECLKEDEEDDDDEMKKNKKEEEKERQETAKQQRRGGEARG